MTARRRSRRGKLGSRRTAPAPGRPGVSARASATGGSGPRSRGGGDSARFGRYPLAIFGFALALRVVHVWQLREAPFFGLTMGDAQSYHAWALEILAGDWVGS